MKTRHQARIWVIQFLFQMDFSQPDFEESLTQFWETRKANAKTILFTNDLIRGVEERKVACDALIEKHTTNWDLSRLGAVDRNVMRLALFEILYRPDIPAVVSINEAVELAKAFGDTESGKFVNGVLDTIHQRLKRGNETEQEN